MAVIRNFLLCFSLIFLITGCVSPWGQWQRAENNLTEEKQNQQNLEDAETKKAAALVKGTDIAIEKVKEAVAELENEVEKEKVKKPLAVAEKLNDRAQLALPPPFIDDVIDMEKIVEDLLSENEDIRKRGESALVVKEREISDLQTLLAGADLKLQNAENKLLQVGRENARLAQKWDDLVGWVWWLIGVIIFLTVLSFILKFLPIFFPMMGSGGTMHRLVRSMQAVRDKHDVDDILKHTLDERDKYEIDRAKRRMGMK
jgi:hypothetical protein